MNVVKKIVVVLMLCVACVTESSAAGRQYVRIATASVGSGFYLIGNTVAQLGQTRMEDVIFTAVTGGSNRNCMALEKSEVEFGLVGSPNITAATTGAAPFKTPLKRLRYVAAIYSMPAHIMVSAESGIKSLADLKGKHIDLANPGSNVEMCTREVLPLWGVDFKDIKTERFSRSEIEEAFRMGQIDAHIWATAYPNTQIADLLRSKVVRLVEPEQDKVGVLVRRYRHYVPYTIAGGSYEGFPEDIHTFATTGSLITHEGMSEDLVFEMTKALFENKDFLKGRMPGYFAEFGTHMALDGRGDMPLHSGAEKYYREIGLMK